MIEIMSYGLAIVGAATLGHLITRLCMHLWRQWRLRRLDPSDFDRSLPIITDAGTGGYGWAPGQDPERLTSLWICSRINEWLDHPSILGITDAKRSTMEEELIRDVKADTGAYYMSWSAGRSVVNIRISRSACRGKKGLYEDEMV